MIDIRSLSVRAGDLVIPAWRRLVQALQQLPVRPGVGVLVTRTSRGSVVSARAWLVGFAGSWTITPPTKAGLRVGTGYLNGKLVPATDPKAKPLRWDKKLYDKQGRSWVVLEIEVNAAGLVAEKNGVRLAQSDHPFRAPSKLIGRAPLAVFVRPADSKGEEVGTMHRIAYFDLQHRFHPGTQRHYFYI
jgi:hypothetical protein